MPIANIIDRRLRPYRFLKINAVAEPTCHDNAQPDSDKIEWGYSGVGYDEVEHATIAEALAWANAFPHWVTLFLYDEDEGIYDVEDEHHRIPLQS